eukprot:scaffold848_cov54-Attheya_sp.AAC.3
MYITKTDDISGCDGEASYEDVNSVDNSEANESNDELDVQHQHVNAHLLDLSKSIAAKEELVEQLFLSQKKYDGSVFRSLSACQHRPSEGNAP